MTDPLQIIVNGLTTVSTSDLKRFLKDYFESEEVEKIVVGYPFHPDGNPAQLAKVIENFAEDLRRLFPKIEIVLHDESYSSKHAKQIILQSGLSKKKRRDKSLVDKVSATLILQDFLQHI